MLIYFYVIRNSDEGLMQITREKNVFIAKLNVKDFEVAYTVHTLQLNIQCSLGFCFCD